MNADDQRVEPGEDEDADVLFVSDMTKSECEALLRTAVQRALQKAIWAPDCSEMRDASGALVDFTIVDAHFERGGIVDFDWSDVPVEVVMAQPTSDEGEKIGLVYEVLSGETDNGVVLLMYLKPAIGIPATA